MTPTSQLAAACGCGPADPPSSVWWRIGGGAFLAMNAMVMAIALNGSEVTAEERYTLELAILFGTFPVFLLLSPEFLAATWRGFRQRRLAIEFLFLIGIAASLAASALYFVRRTGNGYADVAAMLLVVYALGKQIGNYGKERVLKSLADLAAPNRLVRRITGERVPGSEIAAGDAIRVLPGECVPVDFRLTSESALFHEASISGESMAVRKVAGDLVHAGSFALDASADGVSVAAGGNSGIDAIRALIEAGLSRPGAEQGLAMRALTWFVPLVVAVSGGAFLWHVQSQPWDRAMFAALAVAVVACPCALGFATPLAVWMGIARLREAGIVVRSGEALEKLAEVDTVVFDKTGTLTLPEQYEVSWILAPEWREREGALSAMLREAELASGHPLARVLSPLWTTASPPPPLRQVRILPGAGILAAFDDPPGELFAGLDGEDLVVKVNGRIAARIEVKERLAPEAESAVASLEAMGLTVHLATGDSAERAAAVPIRNRHSRQTPRTKHDLLSGLSREGRRVLFAGDGLNDSAAMAWSHVACAAPGAAELVREVSGLWFLHHDWSKLKDALLIARKVRQVVRWNIGFSLAYNLAGVAVAAAGLLHPVASALIMTASSLTVIIYSMHLMEWEPCTPES